MVYQIYPRSFYDSDGDGIGDIPGIISKLDYLQNLGVDVIWLSPVYRSPMDDNGYDISDYQDIAPEFGTLDDMKQLLAEAEQRGIKIVMDLVVNHTSDEHNWFLESKSAKDNPYRDYYIWRDAKPDGSPPDDTQSIFGGPAWQWDESTQQYYFHLFSKRQPDLNWENPQVHQQVYNMMNWWIDLGIGGFRLDVIDLIGKEIDKGILGNGERLHPLLQQMNKATFGDKDLLTVGETWGANPEIAKLYSNPQRNELSMVFQFEHITLTWGNGEKWNPLPLNLPDFKRVLTKWQLELADEGWNSLFWNNHDLPRAVSKYGDDGKYRIESAKMLATALHLLKGTPYIYQGEEIGMTNVAFDSIDQYRDIETLNFYKMKTESGTSHEEMMAAIYENSRDNARTPMQWDGTHTVRGKPWIDVNPQCDGTHTVRGKPWIDVNPNYTHINVGQALEDKTSIFYHYQKLIQLRKTYPVIVYGSFVPLFAEHEQVFAYLRQDESQNIVVINNFSSEIVTIETPECLREKPLELLISNYDTDGQLDEEIDLQPYQSMVYLL